MMMTKNTVIGIIIFMPICSITAISPYLLKMAAPPKCEAETDVKYSQSTIKTQCYEHVLWSGLE